MGPHVSPEDRELLTLESGVTWQRLGQVPHHHVDFLLVTYEPGSASSTDGQLMRHNGTEYAYLISGELKLTLGFDQHVLTPGDSICFESTTPHGYRNDSEIPAVGVWFVVSWLIGPEPARSHPTIAMAVCFAVSIPLYLVIGQLAFVLWAVVPIGTSLILRRLHPGTAARA